MSTIVQTQYGAVEGEARGGLRIFRGIPYGADTSGENRWRPPQPPTPWEGVREATAFGPICAQNQRGGTYATSEDCLSLNVWTPATDVGERRPVLVWIHGGRFIWGGAAEPEYDGAALAAKGLVVVTLNYRLGVFGFLAHPELSDESGHDASGNYGLMDQIAALHWVQANIEAFGGDPGRVTIAGQSAGAACVLNHLHSPQTRGLFHGAIAESGAMHPRDPLLAHKAAAYRHLADAEKEGIAYAAACGAAGIAEMRRLPAEVLLAGNDAAEPGHGPMGPPIFRPVLDGWVFPRSYSAALSSPPANDVPVITGTNKDEDGASPFPRITLADYVADAQARYGDRAQEFLELYPARTDEEARAAANEAARDSSRVSTLLWARRRAEHATSDVYRYFWTHPAPGPDAEQRGAFHGAEIFYFINSLACVERPWTDTDREIAETMSGYIARFVSTGDPNGVGEPRWEPTRPEVAQTMTLGDEFAPIHSAGSAAKEEFLTSWFDSLSRAY